MSRRLSLRLAVATALVGVAVGLAPAGAAMSAAACPAPTVQSSTKAAMAVFTGSVTTVTREARPNGQPGARFVHDVTVTRVYQGRVTTATVQVRTDLVPKDRCSLGRLATGTPYLFFVGGTGTPWVAADSGGTAPATAARVSQVEAVLGPGHLPVPPAPERATFTRLDAARPTTLTRAAAPGAALVLVGLLGLVLVRGRRRRAGVETSG